MMIDRTNFLLGNLLCACIGLGEYYDFNINSFGWLMLVALTFNLGAYLEHVKYTLLEKRCNVASDDFNKKYSHL